MNYLQCLGTFLVWGVSLGDCTSATLESLFVSDCVSLAPWLYSPTGTKDVVSGLRRER